jgi:hypothetical protein
MLTNEVPTNPYLAIVEPLKISSSIAVSLLHKSIRRKQPDWALKAATTLFRDAPGAPTSEDLRNSV